MPPHKKPKTENGAEGWMSTITGMLEHEKNKDFLDAKNIVLATVDAEGQPYARYHVHRGFVQMEKGEAHPLLLTTTDKAMPKAQQIKDSAKGKGQGSPSEYLFWASPTGDQIRVRGLVHLYSPDQPAAEQSVASLLPEFDWEALRVEQWKALSGHLRASFMHKPPGTPVDEDFEEEVERLDVDDEKAEEAMKRFCLVVFEPKKIDWSQQNEKPPVRHTWTLEKDGEWKKQRVAL